MDTSTSRECLRIFVVENHDDTRLALETLLAQLGHEVEAVATMAAALSALPEADADVLISDIGLPDGNGWDLLSRLDVSRVPFAIAMSGYGMNADRERSRVAGYRHHMVKPMDLEKLEAYLAEAALERARAQQPARP